MLQINNNIWVHEDSINMLSVQFGLRMTIVKLIDGGLWIHSPTPLSGKLKEEVEELGLVRFIVGAANGHNISITEWQKAFPQAEVFVSAGIPAKIQLQNYKLLDEAFENSWEADLDHAYMAGVPFFNESVFFHIKSKSLIVTDFIQNHSNERPSGIAGIVTRFLLEPMGYKGLCIAPFLKRRSMIKDKAVFISSVKKIRSWDFERIIVTHGNIIEKESKQVFDTLCGRFLK